MVATVEGLLVPKLMSFDVFGTLIDVRGGSYAAFQSILADAGATHVDVRAFWEHWEERNIAHYWEPYRRYRDICELSLSETLDHFSVRASSKLIQRYEQSKQRDDLYEASLWVDRAFYSDAVQRTQLIDRLYGRYCGDKVMQWHWMCHTAE